MKGESYTTDLFKYNLGTKITHFLIMSIYDKMLVVELLYIL